LHSEAKLDLKRYKNENTLAKNLDSKVGFSEWLAARRPIESATRPRQALPSSLGASQLIRDSNLRRQALPV
jgi:hypothetical protein